MAKTVLLVPTFLADLLHIPSFLPGETRPIKFNLTCETKNLIYMIQCNHCNLQYIGETKRPLKYRFNEHRRTTDNPKTKSKPTKVAEHFLSSPNHTVNDMLLIPIEKIFSNRDSREGYSQKNWVGVCNPLPKTPTLFMTKICDFPNPIYDLTKNLIPYL